MAGNQENLKIINLAYDFDRVISNQDINLLNILKEYGIKLPRHMLYYEVFEPYLRTFGKSDILPDLSSRVLKEILTYDELPKNKPNEQIVSAIIKNHEFCNQYIVSGRDTPEKIYDGIRYLIEYGLDKYFDGWCMPTINNFYVRSNKSIIKKKSEILKRGFHAHIEDDRECAKEIRTNCPEVLCMLFDEHSPQNNIIPLEYNLGVTICENASEITKSLEILKSDSLEPKIISDDVTILPITIETLRILNYKYNLGREDIILNQGANWAG